VATVEALRNEEEEEEEDCVVTKESAAYAPIDPTTTKRATTIIAKLLEIPFLFLATNALTPQFIVTSDDTGLSKPLLNSPGRTKVRHSCDQSAAHLVVLLTAFQVEECL
jgi:hypothetical protein